MLCDSCEEVFPGEPVTSGDCAFCGEACFARWLGGPQAEEAPALPKPAPLPSCARRASRSGRMRITAVRRRVADPRALPRTA